MPCAMNDGVRISYQRVGSGPPLVFHHGFSGSRRTWHEHGYVDALKDDFALILLDARGHGASDKPHDPAAYTDEQRVRDVLAVLDAAGIERAIFWGYSMGGHVGYAIARDAPARLRALIIGGMHPYPRDAAPIRRRAEALRTGGMIGFAAEMERQRGPLAPEMRARLLDNDADALAACSIAIGEAPSVADALRDLAISTLVYAGDRDMFYEGAKRATVGIPQVTFVPLSGLDHIQAEMRSDVVLPHVRAFLDRLRDM
jgi:pimeloyl-ACP methyl ester carboxylesterase